MLGDSESRMEEGGNGLDQSVREPSKNATFNALQRIFQLIQMERYDKIEQLKEEKKIDPSYV